MSPLNALNLFSVKGRVAVVTGGSSGLGLMICKGLVSNGAKVYVVALPTDPTVTEKVQELNELGQETGGSAEGATCDLTSKQSISNLSQTIAQNHPSIDILISNAGIRRDPPSTCNVLTAPLHDLQASMWSSRHSDWTDAFLVNTTAHYFLSVAFLPLLVAAADANISGSDETETQSGGAAGAAGATPLKGKDEGRGVIVITSSCASMHNATNVDLTSYASSKAATDHLVRLLAAKFQRFYVRVVGINPGFVPSNMNPVGAEGNMFASLFDKVPARRAGREEDIAGAALYLASKAGSYIDGISLCIDGGRVLLANGQE